VKLFPQTLRARRRRNCGGFLSLFGGNKTSSTSTTTTEVNSRNRTFNSSVNNNNSGNLNLAIGSGAGDPFAAPGDNLKITAVIIGGLVLAVAVAVKLWREK
jgi:hypothetical protein